MDDSIQIPDNIQLEPESLLKLKKNTWLNDEVPISFKLDYKLLFQAVSRKIQIESGSPISIHIQYILLREAWEGNERNK